MQRNPKKKTNSDNNNRTELQFFKNVQHNRNNLIPVISSFSSCVYINDQHLILVQSRYNGTSLLMRSQELSLHCRLLSYLLLLCTTATCCGCLSAHTPPTTKHTVLLLHLPSYSTNEGGHTRLSFVYPKLHQVAAGSRVSRQIVCPEAFLLDPFQIYMPPL